MVKLEDAHLAYGAMVGALREQESDEKEDPSECQFFMGVVTFPSGNGSEVGERLKREERVLEMWSLGPKRGQSGRGMTRGEERN